MAPNSKFDDMLNRTRKSINMAFDISAKRLGLQQDPHLKLYSMLTSDDFTQLARDFGETDVLQYIQQMEKKRMMEDRDA